MISNNYCKVNLTNYMARKHLKKNSQILELSPHVAQISRTWSWCERGARDLPNKSQSHVTQGQLGSGEQVRPLDSYLSYEVDGLKVTTDSMVRVCYV
jgi:hypothetical protein